MRSPGVERSGRKRWLFPLLALLVSGAATLAVLEIVLRLFAPQVTLSPRWAYSPRYCTTAYPGARMVHELSGRWRFIYTINADSNRGPLVALAPEDPRPCVVVLGDSYSFGAGVADGDEYAQVMQRELGGSAAVLNLALGGWGLTQEIRRFYDFGERCHPRIVILQFSANDPEDNLNCPVTALQGDRFEFLDSHAKVFRVKELLSRSVLQKSQTYNLLRDRIYRLVASRVAAKTLAHLSAAESGSAESLAEANYSRLLEAFVRDLHASGVRVVLLTVNGQLRQFPGIERSVGVLQSEGKLAFYDAADWLQGERDYESPEGHLWGTKAHRILGRHLSDRVRRDLMSP